MNSYRQRCTLLAISPPESAVIQTGHSLADSEPECYSKVGTPTATPKDANGSPAVHFDRPGPAKSGHRNFQ